MEISVYLAIGFIILSYQVRIGVGTITATIDVAIDGGMDTDGITAIDSTCHVVTTIYIMHIATAYQRTCRQFVRELIKQISLGILVFQVRTGRIDPVHGRHNICHTATAIEIVDDEAGVVFDFKEQALGTGHRTPVTTTIQVTHLTGKQVPRRTDRHLCLVITTKEAANLILTTTRF